MNYSWVYMGFGNEHAFILGTYGFSICYILLVSVVVGCTWVWEWACIYSWDMDFQFVICWLMLLFGVHGFWEWACIGS
jgi:hypothetical protein